jgi:hypothetical protein
MKTKELDLTVLDGAYPVSNDPTYVSLSRFGMLSKDIEEVSGTGKNKKTKVIESAGTFYTEKDLGELNEEGKKVWTKEFIGESVDVQIVFERKQLRKFDKSLNKFISSDMYDNDSQIVSLYLDKRVVAKGTREELQARYPKLTEKGKPSSSLNEDRIIYVIYNGELHQFNLSTSSKWSFADYKRQVGNPSKVITNLSSVEETNGSNTYRKVVFKSIGLINAEQLELVQENQAKLNEEVASSATRLLEKAKEPVIEADDIKFE